MINYFSNENITWTDEQLAVLNSSPNKIITGCAGSGKTLLVINLAQKLADDGNSVCIIIFTKSLRTFIDDIFKKNNVKNINVFYEREWVNKEQLEYDYYIIDEFQDFSLREIETITSNARIGSYIFGDEEQRIFKRNLNKINTVKTEELLDLKDFELLQLSKNFRVPKEISEFVNNIYTQSKEEYNSDSIFSSFRTIDRFEKKA
jgi:GTPase SAR1 family protein